jgi:hypothetical protein
MGQPGDLWQQVRTLNEQLLKLNEQSLREFLASEERSDRLEQKIKLQQDMIDLLIARGDLMNAHVENLIERVYVLEGGAPNPSDCTCGYGGFHEPANPRCLRNQRAEMRAGGEIEG